MDVHLVTKRMSELSGEEGIWCLRNTIPGDSAMRDIYSRTLAYPKIDKITWTALAYYEEEIIGWSIREGDNAVVFVSAEYRKRGVGTKLIRELQKIDTAKRIICYPHDSVSTAFFEKIAAEIIIHK